MTKHTPGPWTVRTNPNGTLGIDATEPDGTPCQPCRINGDSEDPEYGPTTWANAHLIAAAPDLLAELTTLSKWARQVSERKDVPMGIRVAAEGLHASSRELIAKAKRE